MSARAILAKCQGKVSDMVDNMLFNEAEKNSLFPEGTKTKQKTNKNRGFYLSIKDFKTRQLW
jgi:hypothetical protein